jgi:CheY-like chemotaxis protein
MNGTILLVDDNSMFIEIEKEFLQSSPVEILTAKDGHEAMQVIKKKRPDLIFMDYQMPKMDGAECCRAIKSDSSLSTIPVVMVTSKGNEDDQNKSYSAGCDVFLTKPLDRVFFLSVARSFLPSINRREKRVQTSMKAVYRVNNESISCTIHNLGVGGAFLSTDYFGIPKSVIQLTFTLPGGAVIDCHGRIAWVNRFSSLLPVGFGVQFALLPKRAEEALADLINDGSVSHPCM